MGEGGWGRGGEGGGGEGGGVGRSKPRPQGKPPFTSGNVQVYNVRIPALCFCGVSSLPKGKPPFRGEPFFTKEQASNTFPMASTGIWVTNAPFGHYVSLQTRPWLKVWDRMQHQRHPGRCIQQAQLPLKPTHGRFLAEFDGPKAATEPPLEWFAQRKNDQVQ